MLCWTRQIGHCDAGGNRLQASLCSRSHGIEPPPPNRRQNRSVPPRPPRDHRLPPAGKQGRALVARRPPERTADSCRERRNRTGSARSCGAAGDDLSLPRPPVRKAGNSHPSSLATHARNRYNPSACVVLFGQLSGPRPGPPLLLIAETPVRRPWRSDGPCWSFESSCEIGESCFLTSWK